MVTVGRLTDDDAFEGDVADVEQGGQDAQNVHDLLLGEEQHLHGRSDLGELVGVVPAFARDTVALFKEKERERKR